MLDFKKANEYITNTSEHDIYVRLQIYVSWAAYKYDREFGHDILATIAIAFAGPFKFDTTVFEEGDICEMLEVTDWGWSDHWFLKLQKWLSSKCKSIDDVEDCKNIFNVLCNSGKSDRIYNCFAQNLNNQPTTAELFPELVPYGFLNGNIWPRI